MDAGPDTPPPADPGPTPGPRTRLLGLLVGLALLTALYLAATSDDGGPAVVLLCIASAIVLVALALPELPARLRRRLDRLARTAAAKVSFGLSAAREYGRTGTEVVQLRARARQLEAEREYEFLQLGKATYSGDDPARERLTAAIADLDGQIAECRHAIERAQQRARRRVASEHAEVARTQLVAAPDETFPRPREGDGRRTAAGS